MKNFLQKIPKGQRIILLLQFFILAAAVLLWLSNHGKGFHKTFSPEEFLVSDNAAVSQDVTVDEHMAEAGAFLHTPALSLERGVYQVHVGYNADRTGNKISVASELPQQLHCPSAIALNPRLHDVTFELELTKDADSIVLESFFSGEGYLSITDVSVAETGALSRRRLFYAFLLCAGLEILYFFYRSVWKRRVIMLALCGILLFISYPLYGDSILYGDDLYYHLLRIEGIAKGLSMHIFPVKIHPVWAHDYGYAVGVFYGDLALYFPAVLRLFGFSVQTAYKFFLFAVNLGTILTAYFSFRRIFQSRRIGLLGCLVYNMAYFRLIDLYRRAAVGEYLSLMFFPLILLSFYLIFTNVNDKNRKKYILLTAFSLTGIVQSHILSCEIALFLILFVSLIMLPRLFERRIFSTLALSAALVLLLNSGFLVPLLDYYGEDILISSSQWVGCTNNGNFQSSGLPLSQLITLLQPYTDPETFLPGNMPSPGYGIGLVFYIGIVLLVILLLFCPPQCRQNPNFVPALLCLGTGVSFLLFSTDIFPWNPIIKSSTVANKLILSLEFPWRFLAPATLMLTFVLCFTASVLEKLRPAGLFTGLSILCLTLSLLTAVWFFSDRDTNSVRRNIYATEQLDTTLLSTNDYLPTTTDPDEIEEGRVNQYNIISLEAYRKEGTQISCHVNVGDGEGFIDFPLIYYKYYQCTVPETGASLPVNAGYNNMVRVTFPANFSGNIQIAFQEPLHWRLAELLSLFTALSVLVVALIPKCRRRFHR